MLYIVATPIGNLKDISLRAIDVLKSVDLIACEDTRHTKILLEHYAIDKPTTSFYQHNRVVKADYLVGLLKEGKDIALVSDAGMPGILDPGYNLINLAIANRIEITAVPGPSAFINALVLSGKPAHEFYFGGFLPAQSVRRRNTLTKLSHLGCTLVFYESCHRIISALEDIKEVFGSRQITIGRELTKKFEEIIRDEAANVSRHFLQKKPRGEFVIII